MNQFIYGQLESSIGVKKQILTNQKLLNQIQQICEICLKTYQNGNKMLIAGNGGSAADAQHIAGELVSKFYFDRPPLPAIAMTTDTSVLTAIGNDYGYEQLFARQIAANGAIGDVFLCISTSGNSLNIVNGIKAAKEKGITCIGLTGQGECKMDGLCDHTFKVPSTEIPRIQETHILIGHILCSFIEKGVFKQF